MIKMDPLDELMQLMLPVQEGVHTMDFTEKSVQLEKDYFISSATEPQQQQQEQEDLLNKLVANDSLNPQLQRTPSIENLMRELESDSTAELQPMEVEGYDEGSGIPADLSDLELHEFDPADHKAIMNAFEAAQDSSAVAWPQTSTSTSSTSLALTYEFKQSVQVTQSPQLPCLREEEQQQQQQLAPQLTCLKVEKQEPEEQQLQLLQEQQRPTLPNLDIFNRHQEYQQPQPQGTESPKSCSPASILPDCSCELESPSSEAPSSMSPEEDASSLEVEAMAAHVVELISQLAPTQSARPQVHQVVIVTLLHSRVCGCQLPLNRLLDFCDKDGHPSIVDTEHFAARDTKAIGHLWQKLKGNRNANYDTFARAMRVGRERNRGYFDYLEAGKGTKKRVYRLANKAQREMKAMAKQLLL